MKIVDRGQVFLAEAGSERSSACFHGVCVLPGGRWLVAFRASPVKCHHQGQRVLITWSDDEGRSWTEPVDPFSKQLLDGKPGGWRSGQPTALGGLRVALVLYWVDESDPERPFFNEQTEGLLDSRIFLAVSEDGGRTWSVPRRLDTAPYTMPTPITGPLLVMPDGEWALQFELNKTYYDTAPWHHQSILMFSRDEGRTWPRHTDAGSDPQARMFYWDQRPAVLADGSLLDLFWTFDRQKAVYRNIHGRASRDGGRTWTAVWDTGVPGQPAPAVSLPDGRIAMVYVDRERVPVIKLRVSADGGWTWPDATELVLDDCLAAAQQGRKSSMQDAWSEMSQFSLGLPATARTREGDLLAVYYAGPQADHTGLHWVRARA